MTTLAELLETPGVTEQVSLQGRLGFMAFHGGLEGGTEAIASAAAVASGASLYLLVQPPTVRCHIPSHVIGAEGTTGLRAFLDHVEVVIAVHGYGRPDRRRDLLLGGSNRDLATRVGAALRRHLADWIVVDDIEEIPRTMRGLHPDNPVNQCRSGGVQLELPPGARGTTGRWMDDNSGALPVPGLVEALTDAALAYTGKVPPIRQ